MNSLKRFTASLTAAALLLGAPGPLATQAAAQSFNAAQASNGLSPAYNSGIVAAQAGLGSRRLPAIINFNVLPVGSPWVQGSAIRFTPAQNLAGNAASAQAMAASAAAIQNSVAALIPGEASPYVIGQDMPQILVPAPGNSSGLPFLQRLKAALSAQNGSTSDGSVAPTQLAVLNSRITNATGNILASGRTFRAFYDNLLESGAGAIQAQGLRAYSLVRSGLRAGFVPGKSTPYLSAAPPAPRSLAGVNAALALPGPLWAAGAPIASTLPHLSSPPEPILFLKAGLLALVVLTPYFLVKIYRARRDQVVRKYRFFKGVLEEETKADPNSETVQGLKEDVARLEREHPFLAQLPKGVVQQYQYHRTQATEAAANLFAQTHLNPYLPLEALKPFSETIIHHQARMAELANQYPALGSRPLLRRAVPWLAQAIGSAALIAASLVGGFFIYALAVAYMGPNAFFAPLLALPVGAGLIAIGVSIVDHNRGLAVFEWIGKMIAILGTGIILSGIGGVFIRP